MGAVGPVGSHRPTLQLRRGSGHAGENPPCGLNGQRCGDGVDVPTAGEGPPLDTVGPDADVDHERLVGISIGRRLGQHTGRLVVIIPLVPGAGRVGRAAHDAGQLECPGCLRLRCGRHSGARIPLPTGVRPLHE